jgi:hypothetical protein
MDAWLVWILPVGLFWPITALHLGGLLALTGDAKPLKELLGLLLGFALSLVVWWVLTKALAPLGPVLGAILLPTGVMLAALPFILMIGFRLVGLRLVKSAAH